MTTSVKPSRARRAALPLLLSLPMVLSACGADDPSGDDGSSQEPSTASASTNASGDTGSTGSAAGAATGSEGDASQCPPAEGTPERHTEFSRAPEMCLEPGVDYGAVLTTDAGAVTVDLLEDKAPNTVNNFVFLARNRYYEGISFHRVIPGFMIQGGDPQGTGSGGPGYTFADELPAAGEYRVGSMAMANAGPDTNGSQFFIVTGDSGVSLPPSYALFGEVTEGMETVTAIEADGSAQGTPKTTHTITKVEITQR